MKYNTKLTLKIYWQNLRPHRLLVILTLFCVVGGSIMGDIIPLYFKRFFDILSVGGDRSQMAMSLVGVLVIIAILEAVRWSFWRSATFMASYFQSSIIARLTNYCFAYLHKHSFSFFNNNFVGSLVKRVNWFSRAFESTSDRILWNLMPLFIDLTFVTVVLSTKSPWLGISIAVWVIIFLLVNWFLTMYKLKYDVQRSEAESKATGVLADTITNNTNVKLFVGHKREMSFFGSKVETVRRLRLFTWNLDNLFEAIQGSLFVALEIAIMYLAIKLWEKGQMSIGDFVLLQSYIIVISDKVWNFGKIIRNIYTDLADAEEMTVILNTPHDIKDAPKAKKLQVAAGAITFDKVDFYYHETRRIFSNLNLKIAAGEKVAFVGPSGAGKSTIVKLLLRMHDVSRGVISIDGQSIAKVTQESLWENVSLVPQDPILFHRSLMENIRYGRPEATDEQVVEAAKLAHCHEFISEFPEQYNTFVGERGVKLSGGERQRVAIARAILRNAPILVLDEATSSLDSESEHLIQDALNVLMQGKTVIVIAHRLSTIMKMDRIMVIDHGEVVEEGTHQELLKKKTGLYNQLWKLQAGGFIE